MHHHRRRLSAWGALLKKRKETEEESAQIVRNLLVTENTAVFNRRALDLQNVLSCFVPSKNSAKPSLSSIPLSAVSHVCVICSVYTVCVILSREFSHSSSVAQSNRLRKHTKVHKGPGLLTLSSGLFKDTDFFFFFPFKDHGLDRRGEDAACM